MDTELQIVTLPAPTPLPAIITATGHRTRRVVLPVRVAPNVEVVDLLRHRLGSPEAVWAE